MTNVQDVVKLALDARHGRVEKYSYGQAQQGLREALIECNGGSTKLNYRNIRDGKCVGLFTLIEEVISRTTIEGLQGDEYFNTLVEFRNVADGDSPFFETEDSTVFSVAEIARGTQGLRRQLLSGTQDTEIPTTLKAVKFFDDLDRVMAGRVDFNNMITKVSTAMRKKLLNDIYMLWDGATAADFGGEAYFPAAGSFNPDTLIEIIDHVEASSGETATIVGTKQALRKLEDHIQTLEANSDLYKLGYYGSFYATPTVMTPQRHKPGSTEFLLSNTTINVIAGTGQPLKVLYEGDPLIAMGEALTNADMTQEYMYTERWGTGLILSGNASFGRYELATT